jgi:predicted RNA methylase
LFRESNHPALYYQDMLSDERRMARYRQAIDTVVQPGDVVVDLGTGLGVLAIMAAQAGASRVYAVDVRSHVIPITQRIIDSNGMADRITLIDADAVDAKLPESVDVIVNELIGDFGTDENIYECVAAIAQDYLRPGGRVLPRRLSTHIVGVSYEDEFRGVFGHAIHGIDLSSAVTDPFKPETVMHGLRHRPNELTEVVTLEDIDFEAQLPKRAYEYEASLDVVRDGDLQGFVGFFDCELAPGIKLDNYPCYPGCHWANWNWPVTPVATVMAGQKIRGVLTTPPRTVASCWRWDWSLSNSV